jgi:hypothetical protein
MKADINRLLSAPRALHPPPDIGRVIATERFAKPADIADPAVVASRAENLKVIVTVEKVTKRTEFQYHVLILFQ